MKASVKKKNPHLGLDDPTKWAAELQELDAAMAGKKTKYWRRVQYPKPAGKVEAKAVRETLNISQLAFAKALGVSLSTKVLRALRRRPAFLTELAQSM